MWKTLFSNEPWAGDAVGLGKFQSTVEGLGGRVVSLVCLVQADMTSSFEAERGSCHTHCTPGQTPLHLPVLSRDFPEANVLALNCQLKEIASVPTQSITRPGERWTCSLSKVGSIAHPTAPKPRQEDAKALETTTPTWRKQKQRYVPSKPTAPRTTGRRRLKPGK